MEFAFKLVVLLVIVVISVHGSVDTQAPCPSGCRCSNTAPLRGYSGRHRWHRLLAAYRLRSSLYGREIAGQDWSLTQTDATSQGLPGREITCVGLSDIPHDLPTDVSKLVMYGNTRAVTESDDSFLGDDPGVDGDEARIGRDRPMTSLYKDALIPSSGTIKELAIEGNKIRSLQDHQLDILGALLKLRLRNNKIRTLTPGAFMGLLKLEELDLSLNQFTKIEKSTFHSLVNLKKLLINNNNLKVLHTRTFKALRNLEELDLSGNSLHYLGRKIFMSNTKLLTLNLDNNNLNTLRAEWFRRLTSLTRLSMQGNLFTIIPSRCFAPSPLRHLSLDHNRITSMRQDAFSGLSQLLTLKLSKNNLSGLEANVFSDLAALQELTLSENRIESLSNESLVGLGELKELDLSRNQLSVIDRDAIIHALTLHHLDLSYNQIKGVARRNFFGLHELRELKLDHNIIRSIEDEAFAVSLLSAYSKLTWLYLDHNHLTSIAKYTLYGLAYVKYLNLGHNSIHTIEEGGFSKLGRLHTFLLNDNALQSLDQAVFQHLTYLHHINLAANRIRYLSPELFNRLEKLEDINLMDNEIEELMPDTFIDTPHLMSINIRKNRLQSLDLGLLDNSPRLKYLDLSRNIISHLQMPLRFRRQLYYLSLADNNFLHLSPDVEKIMAFNGDIHLYGNPWSCDCGLRWLTELDDRRLNLPLSEEIVCKSPSSLSGEQIMILDPSDFVCVLDDNAPSDWKGCRGVPQPSLSCDFIEHAYGHNDSTQMRYSKRMVMDWMVLFLNEDNTLSCSGIRLTNHWVLTKSECWKHWGYDRSVMVKFGPTIRPRSVTEEDLSLQFTSIEEISHYHGPIDIALVRLGFVREENEKRVFPCILPEGAALSAANLYRTKTVPVIMTARATCFKNPTKVRFRSFTIKVLPDSSCSLFARDKICISIMGNDSQLFGERYDKHENYFFTRVSRSKWALGGVNIANGGDGVMTEDLRMSLTPLHSALRWIDSILFT